jgi:hypothetical protein
MVEAGGWRLLTDRVGCTGSSGGPWEAGGLVD